MPLLILSYWRWDMISDQIIYFILLSINKIYYIISYIFNPLKANVILFYWLKEEKVKLKCLGKHGRHFNGWLWSLCLGSFGHLDYLPYY